MSFGKAARRLNVDQPWLSRQIQQLEAQMGFPLFVRSTRRVSLTDEGEALFASAHDLAEAAEQCRQSSRDLMRMHSQTLVLGVNPYTFRSEEHTSELQSLMRISYAVFCLKKKKIKPTTLIIPTHNYVIKKR